MELQLSAPVIFQAVTSVVIAVIGWMLRSVYQDFKQATELLGSHQVRIAVLEEKVRRLIREDLADSR